MRRPIKLEALDGFQECSPERRDERAPAKASDMLLIDLELHADIAAAATAAAQVRHERVRDAAIRIVAPQRELGRGRRERGVPRLDEAHLATVPGIVEEADVAAADLAPQHG